MGLSVNYHLLWWIRRCIYNLVSRKPFGRLFLRCRPLKRANDVINQTNDRGNLDGRPPKKRGRPSLYHPSQPCGPCSVWLQSGRDVRLAQYHRSNPMRHPGHNAQAMSGYVTQPGVPIVLQSDSCVCISCDLDFTRNKGTHVHPRWVKTRDDVYARQKHCIMCCTGGSCPCTNVQEWGPSTWCSELSIEFWGRYFVTKGACTSINRIATNMCRNHLRVFRRILSRVCIKCSSTCTDKWLPIECDDEIEWICNVCETCSHGKQRIEDMYLSSR